MSLESIGQVATIAGVGTTAVLFSAQLLLMRQQVRVSHEQNRIAERQAEVSRQQNDLVDRQRRLDVLERATRLWERLTEENRIAPLFERFPRTDPGRPWAPEHAELAPADQEMWSLAQRVVALDRLIDQRRVDRQLADALANARCVVGSLNDLAELLEWELIDLLPVMQKWHQAIIQRVWILEPLIVRESLRGARWGLRVARLGHVAREYHDVSPVQRTGAISVRGAKPSPKWPGHAYNGVVYDPRFSCFGTPIAEGTWRTATHGAPRSAFTSDADKQAQNRWLDELARRVDELRGRSVAVAAAVA